MKGRVLLIDDESAARRSLTARMSHEGFHVVACPDGISAIHELREARSEGVGFDCVVTAMLVPDIDGLKMLRVLRSRFPGLPVIVMAGFGDERLRAAVLSEGNARYIERPVDASELIEALEELSLDETALEPALANEVEDDDMGGSVSAYLTVRVTDHEACMAVFSRLHSMDGVQSCEAVRGDMDIIALVRAPGEAGLEQVLEKVRALPGLELLSVSRVERPGLDADVAGFVRAYGDLVEDHATGDDAGYTGTNSYIIVDIDPEAVQKVFVSALFDDDTLSCDVIDEGAKLVCLIGGRRGAMGRTPGPIEKLGRVDGVLRVREARIIEMMKDREA